MCGFVVLNLLNSPVSESDIIEQKGKACLILTFVFGSYVLENCSMEQFFDTLHFVFPVFNEIVLFSQICQ